MYRLILTSSKTGNDSVTNLTFFFGTSLNIFNFVENEGISPIVINVTIGAWIKVFCTKTKNTLRDKVIKCGVPMNL